MFRKQILCYNCNDDDDEKEAKPMTPYLFIFWH